MRLRNRIDIRKLIVFLLAVDLFAAGIAVHERNKAKEKEATVEPVPTAAPTAVPETPVPSAVTTPEPSLLTVPYPVQAYAPGTPDNTSGFTSGWYVATTDGNVNSSITYDTDTLNIAYAGGTADASKFYRDGIPFQAGNDYSIYFNASSTVNRKAVVQAVNADDGSVIASMDLNLTGEKTFFTFPFTSSSSTFNGRVEFLLGANEGTESEHTVVIDNIRITGNDPAVSVRINQVGYTSSMQKRCTFLFDAGDLFDVVNAQDNTIVYSGAVVYDSDNPDTNEANCYGDFTPVVTPGSYYIRSQIGVISPVFTISEDPYHDLVNSMVHMLSLQRCGSALDESWAGPFAHDPCHTAEAKVLYMEETHDVSGGWHDAGDYGRYVKTGAKAAADLLLTWMKDPSCWSDDTNGLDSGNGIPDILDEARYELEWMKKMQAEDGGVFARVVTPGYAYDDVSPSDDNQELILMPAETASTAAFGGVMAMAAIAWQDIDPDFAKDCLSRAVRAEGWLNSASENNVVTNPEDVNAGQYLDDDDHDGRFWMEAALYAATKDSSYLEKAQALFHENPQNAEGVSWNWNGDYGTYLLLATPETKESNSAFYDSLVSHLKDEADALLSIADGNGYQVALNTYTWGSNYQAADAGVILAMAYSFTGDQKYLQTASAQVDYLLGRNSLDTCFVSGFGINSPQHLHSRIARVSGTPLPGALAGGPDAAREDDVTAAMSWDIPSAKIYADDYMSYSTNEAAIYYNSALISLIGNLK